MAKNLLVDWMNKAKANNAINPATNIQSRLANTNTASNVISTPNLPTNTGVNLQAAQQPTQTKLDNLNNQTGIVKLQPRQLSKGEMQRNMNQAFLDRLNGGQQGQSRFIGLQKPYQPNTDLGGNITPEYYQRQAEAQRLEEEKERNKPILNIPTVASEKTEFMSNETNKYADTKKALYDLQGDMYKNNRKLTDEELKQLYPEFNLKELKELQDNLRPVVKKGQGVDDKQISQYFPNLLPQKKEASNAKVEMAEDFDNQLKTAVNRGNKLLGSYNTLSKKGVKYLEDAQEVNEFLNYVKDNYKIPGVVTDYDILNYTRQQIPEINTLMTEMDDLMSAGKSGMTAEDYNTIFENGFDLGEGLSDTANALNNLSSTITNYTKDNSSKWKRQLDNLGLNGGAITNGLNTVSEIASIPTTMVGGLAGGTSKFGTALERIVKQQNINEDGSTDWNGVATDVIKGGGGALEVGFNTAYAIPTAIFHAANATELGQEITDDTLGLYQEGIQNILDGSFAQDLGLSKDTYLAKWYNSLDEETKSDLVNELTVATLHKGSKALKEAKLEGEVAIDAITNAFQRGKAAASFQAWVEKGMADEVGAGGKFRYLNKAENRKAAQRIVKEGISEFKDALKENFRLYNTALKNRRGDITSNMNTLPDNRTFKEKAQSKINEAKETINNIKEGAKETVNDIKQGVNEGVNKGVDLAKEGINKGVETVKEGVEAVKNKVTSKKNTEVKPVEESAGWSNNKGVVSKVVGGVAKVGGKVYDTVVEPVATKGAEIITSTTNAQDKLFKAVSPTLNKLTNKRGNYEQKRQNADRTNELIVEYGNVPENTTEYYNALIRTKQALWKNEIKRGLDEHKYTEVDAKEITNAVREAMSDDAKYPLETNKADIELLNSELAALDDIGQLSLERLEAIKQQINAKVNYGKNPTAGEVYEKGLRELNKKISEIEDQMISELPGEFTKFKKDYGALKDMEEDVLKMMLKDMKKKDGGGLIQNRGRIEGLGKLTSKPIEGILQFFLGESLGKAKDVNFNIKTGFEQLKNEYKGKKKTLNVKGKDEGETKSESPKEPTPKTPTENTPTEKVEKTAPKKKSESKPKNKVTSKKSEVKEEKQLETRVENKKPEPKKDNTPTRNVVAKKSAVTEYVNETPQNERGQLEEIEAEENLRSNETPQRDIVEETKSEPKANGGMQRQTGDSRNAKFTNTILDVIESNGGLKDGYLKVEKSGLEPLYIEEIGGGKIAIGQTYIQEGDVMFDPEIVFGVDENGRLQAETIRNDSMGIYEQPIKSNDPFLETWEVNLREFIKSVDKKENANIIGKNNSLTTKNTTNGGKDLGTAESGLNQGVQGASGSRDLQRTDGLSGMERDNSGGISGDLYKEQGNNDLIVDGKSAGPAIGQQQGKLLTRGEARAINQSSKDILEKHNFSTNPKDYTAEEIETLRQYEGAGGLTNKGEDTKGVLDQFYTPQTAIDAVWHLVDKYKKGKDNYTVLEPTVGTGRFIRDRANEKYEGHEIDKVPGTIAQILHPEAKISVGDFEDQFMDFTGRRPQEYQGDKKDIVVGNPPYSQRITPQQKNGLEPKIKRSEEFFIKKGIDVLEDGGVLAMVVPSTFLSNPMTYAKEQIFDNATLVDAYRLPEGVFPYTQVGTDIVVFKKSKSLFRRENNLSDNKRFEQHPEKVLGEVKERINRFGKLEKYVDGGGHPLDKLNAIYEDTKTVPETKKEQAENYSPVETREETSIKQKTTTEITGEKNKVTAKTATKKTPTKKGVKIENQTLIKGDKTDIGDSVFGKGELDNKLLEYSKKTDINGYVEGPVGELVENDPKNLNYYKMHAVTNDLYFAGDIYEKLEQLERDKTHISEAQYKKQKEGLQAVMPEPYTIENHPFLSPLDQNIMEFETNEIGNVYDSTAHDYVDKKLPIKDVFLERFRRNVSSSTVNKNLAREYINGEAMRSTSGYSYGLTDEEKAARARHEKSVVMEQVNEIFNDWLWNKLDKDIQQKLLDKFNRENRSYVVPKYENMALATRGISKTFNGKPFKPQPGQVEGINFLLSKGAGIVAHGVGHGKTIEGVVATREAQLRGWNKRPLIVAPGPTLYAQWVRTIKELYPDWEIVNLGGLTKADIKRLKDELGDDPRNWVKDGQVAILSMQGFGDHIEFRPDTQRELEAKLHDVMETKDLNVRQSESLDKKITQMLAPGKGASSDKYTYSEKGDFLRTMYTSLLESGKEDFITDFVERTKEEYPDLKEDVIRADAEAMWNEKPVLLEDLGIDHITVDEMHNFKNVFTSAKMQEDEYGKKEVNRYGQIIKGNSSARGQKMYLATQYILDRNNNRNVFGLTATPFNNQPIEMYNMLSFVGRNELEKMGLTNINDFFSRFAEFREGLAPKASGTELEYKFIMKDFANARDLQRTITQFINYKGDSEDLIKPEKKLKVPVLKMSELQKKVQADMEYMALAKENQGDVLKATNGMISNLVSPFIVAGTRAPTGWEDFLDNSPKLKYFADVLKELRAEGKQDGMFIYMPVGQEFHELYAEALSEYAGVPREKIGIIDSKTSAKKDEIAEKFRSGEVNVLIGGKNTAEGIDLQNNGYITAITSVGWNPTERVQVDGRVWRQGNFNNEVLSVVPLIENSADVIFMGKADQKGSRINNALEQMLFGGEGDLSADEMMMSLMTEPEKKARTQINIQSQEIDKEIYGLNSQKDRLQELKRRINDAQKDPEEIQKQIDNEKQAGRSWRIPSLKDDLKTATRAKEWIEAYKENNGELPTIEDIDNQTLELEKQVDELRARQSEMKNNDDVLNNLIEEIKKQQAENSKDVKSYQDYIDDIKSDFKNAKRFGSKEELKEYLANKKNNVLANDKNKITSK